MMVGGCAAACGCSANPHHGLDDLDLGLAFRS
jgi:hypothetical protein